MKPTWPDCSLAMIQMPVEPGRPELNLARAEAWVATAAADGADVVLLPEVLDCGWTHGSARERAGAIPDGAAFEHLRQMAMRHGVWLCAGLAERAGDRWYNAAVLLDPDGGLVVHHRKIHEIEFARALYAQGEGLRVAETPWGRVGVMICADAFAPGLVLGRALGQMGARIILSPCAWAVPPDHDVHREPYGELWMNSYGPVAREFGLWVAGCSNVGPVTEGEWRGWRCIGCSLLVDPTGAAVVRGPYGEVAATMLRATIPGAGEG